MFDTNQHITSLSEIEAFARYLYNDVKVAFHPDEPFEDYVNIDTDCFTFTNAEAEILNHRMEESFAVCKNENVDIYEFMMQFSPLHILMQN